MTVIVAAYAMIGSAFLSASLTAPHNCKKILQILAVRLMPEVFLWGTFGLLLSLAGEIYLFLKGHEGGIPITWISIANAAVLLLFLACRRIVATLAPDPVPDVEGGGQHEEHIRQRDPEAGP